MKRVLFFIHDLMGGGAEKVLVNLVNHLDKSNFDVTLQTLFDIGVNRDRIDNNVKYIGGYSKALKGNSYVLKIFSPEWLFHHFIRDDYDIIISYLEGPCARIISGCTNPETKLVCWIHSKTDTKEKAAKGFRSYREAKECYQRFDNIVCVSQWVKDYFVKTFDYKKRIEVLYNTIETDRIASLANAPIRDVMFDPDYINLCSTGKITANKAFDRIARIQKRFVDEGLKTRVYILGVGEEQKRIETYLKDNNLDNCFFFLGFRTNPYQYVKKCDIYICSSYSEGFSTAVTEALIVGTPVVTTLCSGMTELLGDNNEYGIVTENDEESLYEGVRKMVISKKVRDRYAALALERAQRFSTEKTTGAVEKMLSEV